MKTLPGPISTQLPTTPDHDATLDGLLAELQAIRRFSKTGRRPAPCAEPIDPGWCGCFR